MMNNIFKYHAGIIALALNFCIISVCSCSSNATTEQNKLITPGRSVVSDSIDSESTKDKIQSSPSLEQLQVIESVCDFQLEDQANNNYHPRNMVDGNSTTAWAVKLDLIADDYDNGIIVGPIFKLAKPSKIAGVELQNGYCKNSDSFSNNTRASWITIYRYHPEYDGESAEDQFMGFINAKDVIYEGPIQDNMNFQYFSARSEFDDTQVTEAVGLLFHQGKFYRGNKWNDLCLSEIKIFGK